MNLLFREKKNAELCLGAISHRHQGHKHFVAISNSLTFKGHCTQPLSSLSHRQANAEHAITLTLNQNLEKQKKNHQASQCVCGIL